MDNQGGRWGQLGEYSGNPVYDVDYRWDSDSEERTKSWLLWDPPEDIPEENRPEEIYWAKVCQQHDRFPSWQGFETPTTGTERFVPVKYYGLMEERQEELRTTLREVGEGGFGVDLDSLTPAPKIQGVKAVRDEARDRLDVHVDRLNEKVMEPLRKVFIACAVEATRAIRGFSKDPEDVDDETRKQWIDTIEDLHHLYSAGIGRGIRSEKLREHWYEGTFEHVPNPIADGAKVAFSVYVERSEENKVDRSRDGILEAARPVYFKWEAARRMVWSGLYEWPLNEGLEVEPPNPSGSGRPPLIEQEEEVLKTLNVVCKWLDTEPSPIFNGKDEGLVDFASQEFDLVTKKGLKDRIPSIFRQLSNKHPNLPVPNFDTGYDGHDYIENEEDIRELRDEYEARFVEK